MSMAEFESEEICPVSFHHHINQRNIDSESVVCFTRYIVIKS